MKIIRISSLCQSNERFGNKALGLSWLLRNDFPSIDGICIAFERHSYSSSILFNDFNDNQLFQKVLEQFPLVVRSSSANEDTIDSSLAGKFLTITDINSKGTLYESIDKVVSHCFANFEHIDFFSVIIQKFVKGSYSGVLFTSDPVSGKKHQAILSICAGDGAKLVSGELSGNEYLLQQKNIKKISGDLSIPETIISKFAYHLKMIRGKYIHPADIEWTIDKQNRIFFLQIRPITGITSHFNSIEQAGNTLEAGDNKEKINLRYHSSKLNVAVSKGWKVHLSTSSTLEELKLLINDSINSENIFSVVLIRPNHLARRIYRKFCKKDTIADTLFYLLKRLKRHYLFCECIIKEILKPVYTGMIQKIGDIFTIEIARGHFIPKGVTSLNHYEMNEQFNIILKNEPIQSHYYEITEDGHLKKELNKKICISNTELNRIASTFKPLLVKLNCILEFGILKNKELLALDFVKDTTSNTSNPIQTGIISSGVIEGKLIPATEIISSESSFEKHKKNIISSTSRKSKKIIIWALRPSLNLTIAIEKFGKANVGFVFYELSLLNHFSIILRELKIPAIWIDRDVSDFFNKDVLIDADSEKIGLRERLKLIC